MNDPRVRIPQDAVWAEVKRERDALRAVVERLSVSVQNLKAALHKSIEDGNHSLAEIERLRADLGIYGDHLSSCLVRQQPRVEAIGRSRCNCGYFEAVGKGLVRPKE